MQFLIGIDVLDAAQEGEKVEAGVARPSFLGDLTGGHVERGKQARGAVALVVVGVALNLSGLHRQHGLSPVESLDLGLLIDRQDDGPLRRVQIQAHDIADFGLELGVGAPFERLDPMGLEVRFGPDTLDRGDADAGPGRHPPGTPVGHALRRRLKSESNDPIAFGPAVDRLAARSWCVAQPCDPICCEPAAPQKHRHRADAQVGCDGAIWPTLAGGQRDPRSCRNPLLGLPGSGQCQELSPFRFTDDQRWSWMVCHTEHRSCDARYRPASSGLVH